MLVAVASFLSTPSARRATCEAFFLRRQLCISIHALREEGDRDYNGAFWLVLDFYPRPPRGGRQLCPALFPDVMGISIHALREEGDSGWKPRPPLRCNFYPRPPRGGRHDYLRTNVGLQLFLSTPSARRATRRLRQGDHSQMISIHALREEGDCFPAVRPRLAYNFYPRPPRGGRPACSL